VPAQSARTEIDRRQACEHLLLGRRRVSVRRVTRVRGENARSQIRSRFAGAPENRRQVHPSQTVPAGASKCENDSAANRASRQARNGLTQDHSRATQGGRNGRRWGSEGDRHETKDDSARFKHPSRLSSHIAYAQAGGQFAQ
jgi:hypothetical protein